MTSSEKVTGMVVLLALLLALLPAVTGSLGESPPLCCEPGVGIRKTPSRTCDDGQGLRLNCSTGIYTLDPAEEEDELVFNKDGSLSLGEDTFPATQFCKAQIIHPDNPLATKNVALVCVEPDDAGRPIEMQRALTALSLISVCCLAITLMVHGMLPEIRDLQGCCHMGAVSSLGVGLLSLSTLQEAGVKGPACTVTASLVYYWLLSAFFWLNATSFNVWRSVVLTKRRFQERQLFAWYCLTGWGAPLLMLVVLLTVHHLPEGHGYLIRPKFDITSCWFHEERATWAYFYGPVAVLLTLNIVYFVWTTAQLWRQYNDTSLCRRKMLKKRFTLSLKLFLIMGVSWIFELLSSASDKNHIAWYVTDAFNALQGVVILTVLVLFRRRVWRALYKRRPCGWRPPESWAYPRSRLNEIETTDSEDADEEDERAQELKDMTGRTYVTYRL